MQADQGAAVQGRVSTFVWILRFSGFVVVMVVVWRCVCGGGGRGLKVHRQERAANLGWGWRLMQGGYDKFMQGGYD
jgi:hypothetical protein